MSTKRIETTIGLSLDISDAQRGLTDINATFKQLALPKKIQEDFEKLTKATAISLKNLDGLMKLDPSSKTNFKKQETELKNLMSLMSQIQTQFAGFLKDDGSGKVFFKDSLEQVKQLQAQLSELHVSGEDAEEALAKLGKIDPGKGKTADLLKEVEQTLTNITNKADVSTKDLEKLEVTFSKIHNIAKGQRTREEKAEIVDGPWTKMAGILDEVALNLQRGGKNADELKVQLQEIVGSDYNRLNEVLAQYNLRFDSLTGEVENFQSALKKSHDEAKTMGEIENQLERITKRFFGLTGTATMARKIFRDAFATVKELDQAMTETAVVTDFTVSEMWSELPRYTQVAREHGATIQGAYETMTLYYQQGR